jgi:hypothetical protein
MRISRISIRWDSGTACRYRGAGWIARSSQYSARHILQMQEWANLDTAVLDMRNMKPFTPPYLKMLFLPKHSE